MSERKYKLTKDYREIPGSIDRVYRVEAVKRFRSPSGKYIRIGDRGGFVQGEENLSHSGKCWIFDDSAVWHGGRVEGDAAIADMVWVYNGAIVSGKARVLGSSMIRDRAEVSGSARIMDGAIVESESQITGSAIIIGEVTISGAMIDHGVFKDGA